MKINDLCKAQKVYGTNLMIKYETISKSNDGMPQWNSFFNPVLTVIQTKDTWINRELKTAVVDSVGIPAELKERRYEDSRYKNNETIAENRVGFAISALKNAGLISSPKRGIVKANEAGIKYLQEHGDEISEKQIKSLPKYREHEEMVAARKKIKLGDPDEINEESILALENNDKSEFLIDDWVERLNGNVATDLLDRILENEPVFFERLTVDLLVAMGYKGPHGKALTTQLVGDQGIDGIINEDPLGTKTIYVQAKRFASEHPVDRPDIQKFYGALAGQGNEKGVFITTSKFTKNAQAYADKVGNIITIDGIQLTNLMLEYKVGVNVKKKFEMLDIDEDYFTEE